MPAREREEAGPARGSLGEVALLFPKLGTIAFGGGQAALPPVERIAVSETGWLSPQDFAIALLDARQSISTTDERFPAQSRPDDSLRRRVIAKACNTHWLRVSS